MATHRHPRQVVLKSRQHGISSWGLIDMLDDCIWTPAGNVRCGLVADDLDDGKDLLDTKFSWVYETMGKEKWNDPEDSIVHRFLNYRWRQHFGPGRTKFRIEDNKESQRFINHSQCFVDTTMRSTSLDRLHISEFGKISAIRPEVAKEIIDGSLPAVALNGQIIMESTAEGMEGKFFDICEEAREVARTGRNLAAIEWYFVFFAWWEDEINTLTEADAELIQIPKRMDDYFDMISSKPFIRGINEIVKPPELTKGQKAWYVATEKTHKESMFKEHPSDPDEAFKASVDGAYYATQFAAIDTENRICNIPMHPGIKVDTWWDLGMDDSTSIWFSQTVGREIHLIYYLEDCNEGLAHYVNKLDELAKKHQWIYGRHVGPHDIEVRELGTGISRRDTARQMGLSFQVCPAIGNQAEGINAVRELLPMCWFDVKHCNPFFLGKEVGIKSLRQYRREWDEKRGKHKNAPEHNWASHGAKAFETLALMWPQQTIINRRPITQSGGRIKT